LGKKSPDVMSQRPKYLKEYKRLTDEFVDSITESEEETIQRKQAYDSWVRSTFKHTNGGT